MKFIVSILISICISLNIFAQKPAEKIPAFTFFRQDKTAFINKDLASNKLLYFVFFDTDCDHCQHAVADINKHSNDFENASVYLLTLDNNEKIATFMNKYGNKLIGKSNITILQDTLQEFIVKFKPKKYPAMFLYSPQRELIMYSDDEKQVAKFVKRIQAERK